MIRLHPVDASKEAVRKSYLQRTATRAVLKIVVDGFVVDIECAAGSDVNLLITGGSTEIRQGLGYFIHQRSNRSGGPFVVVDRAGLAYTLPESRNPDRGPAGASHADLRRPGWVDLAHGGTLFIEEVGELSLSAQAELLHLLERRAMTSAGSNEWVHDDVRVIASTRHNLLKRIDSEAFRLDLLYRLNIIHLAVPPVRPSSAR